MSLATVPPERRRSAVLTVLAAAPLAAVVGYAETGTVGGAAGFGLLVGASVGVGPLRFDPVRRAI